MQFPALKLLAFVPPLCSLWPLLWETPHGHHLKDLHLDLKNPFLEINYVMGILQLKRSDRTRIALHGCTTYQTRASSAAERQYFMLRSRRAAAELVDPPLRPAVALRRCRVNMTVIADSRDTSQGEMFAIKSDSLGTIRPHYPNKLQSPCC